MNMAEKLRLRQHCHEWQNSHTSQENCHNVPVEEK